MEEEKDLIIIANEMSKKEKEYANSLRDTAELFRHPIIKALIEAISFDSEKHHLLFNALAQLFEQKTLEPVVEELLTIPKEEADIAISMIHDHISVEERMMKSVKKLAEEVKDENIKVILNYIYEDEVRHHKLLTYIRQRIIEKYKEEG